MRRCARRTAAGSNTAVMASIGSSTRALRIEFSKSLAETLIFGSNGSADLRTPTFAFAKVLLIDSAKVGEDTYLMVPSTLVGRRAVGGDGVGYV